VDVCLDGVLEVANFLESLSGALTAPASQAALAQIHEESPAIPTTTTPTAEAPDAAPCSPAAETTKVVVVVDPQPSSVQQPESPSTPKLSAPAQAAPATSSDDPDEFRGRTVLVVEDEPTNRRMLSMFLERSHFRVLQAADGNQALAVLDSSPVDVVLLDVMMPGLTGLEVLEQIRKTKGPSELPVIMVTAVSDNAEVIRAQSLGANDYVTKPYEFKVLLARMKARLSSDPQRVVPVEKGGGGETVQLDPEPPILDGACLRFATATDYEGAKRDISMLRAVLAVSTTPLVAIEQRRLKLCIGAGSSTTELFCSLSPGGPGRVVVQFDDLAALRAAQAEALHPPPATVETEPPPPPSPAASPPSESDAPVVPLRLPPEGRLHQGADPRRILGHGFSRALTTTDLEQPSIVLLLRWLRSTRGLVRVYVSYGDQEAYSFCVINGAEVRASASLGSLARSLVGTEGRYRIEELKRLPTMVHRASLVPLLQETLRALAGTFPQEALVAALCAAGGNAPQLSTAGAAILQKLELPFSLARFAESALQGASMEQLLSHEVGARPCLEVLFVLEMFGGLTWQQANATTTSRAGSSPRSSALDEKLREAEAYWAKIASAKYFEVLGLHWCVAPRRIEENYRSLERDYGPQGTVRAASAELASKIWQRVEEAYAVLSQPPKRQEYRRKSYAYGFETQVEQMLGQAELALMRKDLDEAHDLLTACQDIHHTDHAMLLLAKYRAAMRGLS
ncbi:MAG: response regulator, partial [Myxococcota bacterium]